MFNGLFNETYLNKKNKFHKALCKLTNKLDNFDYATKMYSALCNMKWVNDSLKEDKVYSCSWRFAGGLVAELRNKGEDYLDFYCSGHEGVVDEEIKKDLAQFGWTPKEWEK